MMLFDLDGTLSATNEVWEEIDLAFLGARGLAPTEEYVYTVGHSIFPVAAQFTKDYYHLDMTPREIMDEWDSMAREAYRRAPLKPGVARFLARRREAGERMALLSACLPERGRDLLALHGLTDYFEDLIFAQELGMEKRNEEIYRLAAARLGVATGDCVFFEDAPANCAAAKAAGMQVVGVYDHFYHKYEAEMRKNCHKYIMSFEELPD